MHFTFILFHIYLLHFLALDYIFFLKYKVLQNWMVFETGKLLRSSLCISGEDVGTGRGGVGGVASHAVG